MMDTRHRGRRRWAYRPERRRAGGVAGHARRTAALGTATAPEGPWRTPGGVRGGPSARVSDARGAGSADRAKGD